MTKKEFAKIHRRDSLPIFYHPDWLDIVAADGWHLRYEEGSSSAYSFMVYQIRRKLNMSYGLNFQYTPYTGFYTYPEDSLDAVAQKKIVQKLTKGLELDYQYFFLHPSMDRAYPYIMSGYEVLTKYSYIKKLSDTDLIESIDRRLRKALTYNKENIEVQISEDIEGLCRFHDAAYDGQNPFDSEILKSLYDRFGGEHIYILEATSDQKKLGAILIAYDMHCAYYLAGGSDRSSQQAMSQLLYGAMLHAQKLGIPIFDFCGSSIPSIEKFFRKFGPEISDYFALKKSDTRSAKVFDLFVK